MSMEMNDAVIGLRLDQCQRWQAGDRVRVEAYLKQQPELRQHPECLLDLIYNEIVLCEEVNDPPRLEDYIQRFPELADELRVQFVVHKAIEAVPLTGPATVRRTPSDKAPVAPRPTIPGFGILGELGHGGMGVVYTAKQLRLKRLVALKVIRGGSHAGPSERDRFRTEAEAAARLQHPNIVQIYEVGEHEGLPYLALELVAGPSLDKAAAGGPLPLRFAAHIVETLARAMHYAHQQGIIHRDLKPANILLDLRFSVDDARLPQSGPAVSAHKESKIENRHLLIDKAIPKITDFGLAKLLNDQSGRAPTQALIGTPNYMAPEQATAKGMPVGPPADVYALGAILYELLTGRPPFNGESALEIMEQVRIREPVAPGRLRTHLPRDLETICLKCLEKEPGQRYGSALDLADDLGRFLALKPIRARAAGMWERTLKWSKRRPALAGLIGVSVAAIASFLLLGIWHVLDVSARQEQTRAGERLGLQQARLKYEAFAKHRGDAMFHGIYGGLFPDSNTEADLKETRAAVARALDVVDLNPALESTPALDPYWSERERTEVAVGCYQLLVILADVTARLAPGQIRKDDLGPVELLDRAARLVPPTRAYHLRRAAYLAKLGDGAGARRERTSADEMSSTTMLDYFLLADERLREGDVAAAAQGYDKALLLEPNDFWCQYCLAICQLRLKRAAEAQAGLTKCLALRPDFSWGARLARGIAYSELIAPGEPNAYAAAEDDFGAALEMSSNEKARYPVYVSRGILRFRQGQLVKAVSDLRQAVALEPGVFHVHLTLAKLYQAQNRRKESSQQFREALALNPPAAVAAECHAELSRNLYLDQRYSEALSAAEAAVKVCDNYADGHRRRGLALLQLNQYAVAVRSFDQFLAHGGKPDTDFFRARGSARVPLSDYLGAKDDYTRALEFHPDSDLWAHRGWAYFFADAWKPALSDFDKALDLDPDNGPAYAGRGLARVMLGLYREAAADADEAWRRNPRTPEMMHNVACIFALAASRVEKVPAIEDKKKLKEQYINRALEAVQKTLELVAPTGRFKFWHEKVVPDTALDSIRNCPAFKVLNSKFSVAEG